MESQIPRSKLRGMAWLVLSAPRGGVFAPAGHLPSRHSPNIRARAAAWLIARGNKFTFIIPTLTKISAYTLFLIIYIINSIMSIPISSSLVLFLLSIIFHNYQRNNTLIYYFYKLFTFKIFHCIMHIACNSSMKLVFPKEFWLLFLKLCFDWRRL